MKIEKINFVNNQTVKSVENKKSAPQKTSDRGQLELSNVYYKPVSFGRRMDEHKSWGATVDPKTKEIGFKLFTYPDVRKVVALVTDKDNPEKTTKIELENKGKGVFEKMGISPKTVKAGDKYVYQIHKNDGQIETIKDPYSFKQEELNGASTIYDHSEFEWKHDAKWQDNVNRVKRTSTGRDNNGSVRDLRIYALSPDTITDKRSYEGVIDKLKQIKKDGFNAVEIMHVENTYSFNWGYDGVDKMSPSDYLGGPDGLKKLVDEAHKEGLNVIFDIIPNHIGPDGNQLGRSGPYVKGPNDFGDALNYEGENSEYVRDYIINSAMNWVKNYHVDGLRLDMTKYMNSDYTLKQLAAEMNYHYPDCYLIAEDGRSSVSVDGYGGFWENHDEIHDKRVTSTLWDEEYGRFQNEDGHSWAIEKIIRGDANLARLGMNSEWDFNFYHQLDNALYCQNTTDLIKAALCAQDGVKYVASHDEIGNFEGTRKLAKLMVPKLRLNDNISLSIQDIKRAKEYSKNKGKSFEEALKIVTFQKAQFVAESLAVMYQTGELDKYKDANSDNLRTEVFAKLGIANDAKISYQKIRHAFEDSLKQVRMATAFTYGVPGPKMIFQGDEKADLTPFRFFRKFESIPYEEYLYTEKGYAPAEAALEESTMGKIKYSKQGQDKMDKFETLVHDLNKINLENSALRLGYINPDATVDHPSPRVVAMKSEDKATGNEIFAVTNFGETSYSDDDEDYSTNDYYIKFPEGRWVEILNTDDQKYGGDSKYLNTGEVIHGDNRTNSPINLAAYSTVYFKRVG